MSSALKLENQRFGRLVVLERTENRGQQSCWLCQCDCGNFTKVTAGLLRSGRTKSCGCLLKEASSKTATKNLTGRRFGKLTVITRCGTHKSGRALWLCQCDCGNEHIAKASDLLRGSTSSCGCNRGSHHMTGSRLYRIWNGMKTRCYYPHNDNYSYYGGRGISICDEWRENFETFMQWSLSNGYNDELSIDRINVEGDYEPENCRWVDWKTQCNNRRPRRV